MNIVNIADAIAYLRPIADSGYNTQNQKRNKGGETMKPKSPIKERLKAYTSLLLEIKIEEQRAKAIIDDGSVTGRRAMAGIRDHIKTLLDKENTEYEALIKIINALPCVEQRQVVLARYMDGLPWGTVNVIVFGKKDDFDIKRDSYQRRIYRIHGNALANANRILTMAEQEKGAQ